LIKFKLFIIFILLAAVIYLYIQSDSEERSKADTGHVDTLVAKRKLTEKIFDSVITAVQKDYAIPDSFFVRGKKNKPHRFFVPEDLPLPTVVNAFWNIFSQFNDKCSIGYDKKEKNTLLSVNIGDKSLKMLFLKKKNFSRTYAEISIMIKDYEKADEEERKFLEEFPEQVMILIQPTKKMQIFVKDLEQKGVRYCVSVGSSDADFEYKIEDGQSKKRIVQTVSGLVSAFPKALWFITDANSSLAKSMIFPFVREKFEAKKKQLIESDQFIQVSDDSKEAAVISFNEGISKSARGKNKIFLMSPQAIQWVEDEIAKLRKKGLKITAGISADDLSAVINFNYTPQQWLGYSF